MIIEKIRRPDADGGAAVSCEITFESRRRDSHFIYARTEPPHALAADPNGFLLGAFLPAWTAGESRIRIDGAVCPLLAANLLVAAGLLRRWWADLPVAPVIECDHEYRALGTRSAAFFSGGVDSLAMIRNLTRLRPPGHPDRPSAAIVVDFPGLGRISRAETDARFARSMAAGRRVCAGAGLDVIPVSSNFCRLNPDMHFWMYRYHAAFLAGMAHFLGREYRAVHIASSFPATDLKPYGSHAELDPLYSSQHVRIAHEGAELTRLQKVKAIADWPDALEHLYVCASDRSGGANCGQCEKCVRTRLHLLIAGKLGEAGAFQRADLGARDLTGVRIGTHGQRLCYRDAIPELLKLGRQDLVAACRLLLDEYERQGRQEAAARPGQRGIRSAAPQTRAKMAWVKKGGWLAAHLAGGVPLAPHKRHIEAVAAATNRLGPQQLADAYGEPGGTPAPAALETFPLLGDLYARLVQQRRPDVIVELGAAFGVSGMYFASGLEAAGTGHLYSFEINRDWADIAERNIRSVSGRFTLARGAFEDRVAEVVEGPIDIAFVDAIHRYEAVMRQFELLRPRMAPGGIVLLDDIDFDDYEPGARMGEAWRELAARPDVVAAAEVHGRLGILELAPAPGPPTEGRRPS